MPFPVQHGTYRGPILDTGTRPQVHPYTYRQRQRNKTGISGCGGTTRPQDPHNLFLPHSPEEVGPTGTKPPDRGPATTPVLLELRLGTSTRGYSPIPTQSRLHHNKGSEESPTPTGHMQPHPGTEGRTGQTG